MPSLDALHRHFRLIGVIAIAICALTWAVDLAGLVYKCPFCRAQRTVIGLLGLLMLLPDPRHWLVRWPAASLAAFGLYVASYQHFGGWRKIHAGEFAFSKQIYVDPFLLSGAAVFLITGLVLLIFSRPAPLTRAQ